MTVFSSALSAALRLTCCVLVCDAQLGLAQGPGPEATAEWQQARRASLSKIVQDYSAVIETGPLEGEALADAYRNRGVAYSYLLEYERAEADFTRAVELSLVNAQLYEDRAIILLKLRRFEEANRDLDMALGLDRKRSAAYREKGRLAAYRGDWQQAAADFNRALDTASGEAMVYSAIWLELAIKRAGLQMQGPLDSLSATMSERWPKPVVLMYTGALSPQEAVDAALAPDFRTTLMQQCEAYFYAGQHHLAAGRREEARTAFRAAVATGVTDFLEYDWAERELELLDKK